RRERPRPPARADERRAAAVDDVDRASGYSAAVGGDVGDDMSPLEQRLCLKQGPMRAAIAVVIAGLDPAIHPVRKKVLTKRMDPRVKRAGDGKWCGARRPLTRICITTLPQGRSDESEFAA